MMFPETKPMRDIMTDFSNTLNAVRRPKILIRAARAGLAEYRRDRDLKRILKGQRPARDRNVLVPLLAEEERIETQRQEGDATYSVQRHVMVLTALIAEARNARLAQPTLHVVTPAPRVARIAA
jgi:hypothetical protein